MAMRLEAEFCLKQKAWDRQYVAIKSDLINPTANDSNIHIECKHLFKLIRPNNTRHAVSADTYALYQEVQRATLLCKRPREMH